ncbi:MAG: heavy metal translocating P-type ATPase [Bacteroidales bacterium]|jgi:Cu2+-exporting ATPase|nr:heavy metal translocating P-type ATPase [Bacteroidales bacterium]
MSATKKTYPLLHLSCAGCAAKVEQNLNKYPGVSKAAVNFASSVLSLEFDAEAVSPADLRHKVQELGYDLLIETTSQNQTPRRSALGKALGALLLSIPVFVISMFYPELPGAHYWLWALSTPVVLWFGRNFFIRSFKQVRRFSADMDSLVALSTGVAYVFSVIQTFFPRLLSETALSGMVFYEAASMVIAIVLLGRYLEERAKDKSASAIRQLMGLQVKTAMLLRADGSSLEIPVNKLQQGDLIQIRSGEKFAVDGSVHSGYSLVDESMLSGEALPVYKTVGAQVFAGTINQNGSLVYRAEKLGKDSLLSQIIQQVQEAQNSKAKVQKKADKLAAVFVPLVLSVAVLSFALWLILGGEQALSLGLKAFITVLVIACPCALGLATPTAIMVGMGRAAQQGILIKNAEALERAKKIDTVVLDKTGTITEGRPRVSDIHWLNKDELLKPLLLTMEKTSSHPLSQAMVDFLEGSGGVKLSEIKHHPGLGLSAVFNKVHYYVGSLDLLHQHNIIPEPELESLADSWSSQANSLVWFAGNGSVLALAALADKVKEGSPAAIHQLQQNGIEVYMLTGDNQATAAAIAAACGISKYRSKLLPQDKADIIKQLQLDGKKVAMAGDGINDSTALATADLSIAMGKGSDIAMEVADMTLISSDLNKLPQALNLSSKTLGTIHQNLFWAFIYNLIGIPLAAGLLYPLTGIMLNPMIAAAAMGLSSISVVLNSLRLKWK